MSGTSARTAAAREVPIASVLWAVVGRVLERVLAPRPAVVDRHFGRARVVLHRRAFCHARCEYRAVDLGAGLPAGAYVNSVPFWQKHKSLPHGSTT
jgi:hypothetical protein